MHTKESPTWSRMYMHPKSEIDDSSAEISELKLDITDLQIAARFLNGKFSEKCPEDSLEKDAVRYGEISFDFSNLENGEARDSSSPAYSAGKLICVDMPASMTTDGIIFNVSTPFPKKAFLDVGSPTQEDPRGLEITRRELSPLTKMFFCKTKKAYELFIPVPQTVITSSEFNGQVNCFSISPRSGIRFNSGLVSSSREFVQGFDGLMHRGVQKELINAHVLHFNQLKR